VNGGNLGDLIAAEMTGVLSASGLVSPSLPRCVLDGVTPANRGELWTPWAWRSNAEVNPWWCYFGTDRSFGAITEPSVLDVEGDFFVLAHVGRGVNSYGLGIVARLGGLLIDQQVGWGGAYMDEDETTQNVNAAIEAWNALMPEMEALADRPLEQSGACIRLQFSDYRRTSRVEVIHSEGNADPADDPYVPPELADVSALAFRHLRRLSEPRSHTAETGVPVGATYAELTGVRSPTAVFAEFRAPGGIVALVAHDGESAWVTAPNVPSPDFDGLRRSVAQSSPAGVWKILDAGDDWPGWVVTRLSLSEYLLSLVGWSADFDQFSPTAQAQMMADVWNGCGPVAAGLGAPQPDNPVDFLPGRIDEDTDAWQPAVSPSLVPGGFPGWRVALAFGCTERFREFGIAAEVIVSRIVLDDAGKHLDPHEDYRFLETVTAELESVELTSDPGDFRAAIGRAQKRAEGLAARTLNYQLVEGENGQSEESARQRRAELGLQGGRKGTLTSRFRNWLADQIRRLG
jgi:hypothetical protein